MHTPHGEELSHLVWEVLQVASKLTEAGNRLSAPFGLTAARWQVMGMVAEDSASVADIARRLSQTRQGVQRLADELVRDGLADYSPNPRHARAKLLGATPEGAVRYRELMKEQAKWVNALSSGMRLEAISSARKLLKDLDAAIRA